MRNRNKIGLAVILITLGCALATWVIVEVNAATQQTETVVDKNTPMGVAGPKIVLRQMIRFYNTAQPCDDRTPGPIITFALNERTDVLMIEQCMAGVLHESTWLETPTTIAPSGPQHESSGR